ncbi:Neutral/alkaline non-lysosomal ceramidase [Anatilimnocola aggregata]|uniref:Neutral/alkaline non-lysosomal ceramidase n=1 Tax=Anatilimnocola aggregata TaxID=2528021 RepID=A0A517Y3Z5_9BACT|nr:Neutral/alkaline non-lysosomal ceramidase [Anatilimnocola aggregata]
MKPAWHWTFLWTCSVLIVFASYSLAEDSSHFRVESNLRASVVKIDITPPADTPVVGHVRPTNGVRDPIRAGVLLLANEQTRAAIVTLDLISASGEMVAALRDVIALKTEIPRENIMVATSHNHSGPGWSRESAWSREMVAKLGAAAGEAAKTMRPVTIGYGEDRIDFNINRRKVIDGRALFRLNPDGPCDHRVKVLRFDDGRTLEPMSILMHAVCHPCVFTWGDKLTPPFPQGFPKISADFPGEAQTFVETVYGPKTQTLFLQGCAGDIRPNLPGVPYRCGDEADIKWTGRSLGCAVVRAADRSVVREELAKRKTIYPLKCASSVIELPGKKEPLACEMQAMRIGDYLLLTIPGEPMVEYGFQIEKAIADRAIPIVIGYANGNLGYICTAKSHEYGGYEPESSKLLPEAEPLILKELGRLADKALADIFESIKPTSK